MIIGRRVVVVVVVVVIVFITTSNNRQQGISIQMENQIPKVTMRWKDRCLIFSLDEGWQEERPRPYNLLQEKGGERIKFCRNHIFLHMAAVNSAFTWERNLH